MVYEEKQYPKFLNLSLIILWLLSLLGAIGISARGENPLGLFIAFGLISLMLALFYSMLIRVEQNAILIVFGLGIIRKRIDLTGVDITGFCTKKIPWWYGIGWKWDYQGNTFFCIKPGLGLGIKFKGRKHLLIINTKNLKGLQDSIVKTRLLEKD